MNKLILILIIFSCNHLWWIHRGGFKQVDDPFTRSEVIEQLKCGDINV